ncbi:MAG: FrgA protein, partial [Myxococcaceae bacterium]|nr:FrgA protein [Myxococcaceae bacterium]
PTQAEAQLPVEVASAPLPAHPMAARPGDETLDGRGGQSGEDTLDERLQMPAAVAEQTYDERLPAAPALTPEGRRPTGEAGAVARDAKAEALSPVLPLPEAATAALGPADWSLSQARDALKLAAQDRDQLLAVVLEYGRRAFEFTAAFAVVRGAAWAWDARAEGGPVDLRGVAVPLDAASIFRTVALTRGSYVGPLPPDSHTQHYLALFGRAPRACFVWPVEVKGRLVALLYGDTGTRPMSQRRLADFILFCQDLPAAFHELIAFRKLRTGAGAPFAEAGGEVPMPTAPPEAAPGDDQAPPDAALIEGLISLLTGPDDRERAEATAELQRAPAAAAQALAARFPGPTGWSRLPVVELPEADELGPIAGAMSRLGRDGARALAPLLDSDDSDVRYFALLTAGALPFPELLPGVLRGLFDFEPDVSSAARAAASALKHVEGFAGHLKQLHQELSSRDSLRRSLAARALGMLHDREAIEGLINLTGSDDQLSAQAAAEALRDICKVNLGTKPRAWLSWFAQARAQRRTEWLLDALAAEDFELRLGAIEELSRSLGDNLGYFADGAPDERSAAVERWRSAIAARPSLEL